LTASFMVMVHIAKSCNSVTADEPWPSIGVPLLSDSYLRLLCQMSFGVSCKMVTNHRDVGCLRRKTLPRACGLPRPFDGATSIPSGCRRGSSGPVAINVEGAMLPRNGAFDGSFRLDLVICFASGAW
jgi:hypothetical protein